MILVDVVLILFWSGFLLYGVMVWALNKSFEQLHNIELDEIDRDNINWFSKRKMKIGIFWVSSKTIELSYITRDKDKQERVVIYQR